MPSTSQLLRSCAALLLVLPLAAQEPGWVATVDKLVAERLAKPDAVGFSVGIAQRGQVVLAKGYGLAEAEFKVPANATTRFRIGSVTKQFTAALVMRLVEQKKLSLDDGLEAYVPEFPLQDKKVTIHMLLNHSSGIPSYTDIGEEWIKMHPLELSHEQLLALVAGKPFDFEPGTDWKYNNTGYYLLGMVLEKVHGKTYAEVVQEELAAPLKLEHTRYDSNRELIENRAQGYSMRGDVRTNDDHLGMSQPGAAGALLSTGGDLVSWSMSLAGGKFVSPDSWALMTKPLILPNGQDTGYGFGLMIGDVEGKRSIHHGGGIHGFNSVLLHLPEDDLHVAVISNGEHASSQKLAQGIVRAVLGITKFVAKKLPLPAELRDRCVGEFHMETIGMTLGVTKDGDKLCAQGRSEGQGEFELLWQGGLEFRADFDNDVKLLFSEDCKQVTLWQGGRKVVGVRQ